ncbi:GNAT family N-acetyltransferase [Actinomadura terrae]|uniref:GNAT family N-acetyltransferase n=1 Tax=Actinomadura terrae TaxID=604353 RepID=UPI001FA6D168|nr:GNAT family N-acetyltransferase [Actinomadura terrae]
MSVSDQPFPGLSTIELTTDRLALRAWTRAEVSAVTGGGRLAHRADNHCADNHWAANHWADDFPADGDRVIAELVAGTPSALGEYGQRQIVERATGLVVGSAGLFWPPAGGAVEFGYGVVPSRRGRGYATEAARALVAFALTAPGVDRVTASAETSNPASIRVLENAGLRRVDGNAEIVRYTT